MSVFHAGQRDISAAAPMTPTAAPSASEPDPYPPAPLTVERLEEASRGWVEEWADGGPLVRPSSCVVQQLNLATGGDTVDEDRFRAGDRVAARLVRSRFKTPIEAGRMMFVVHQAIEKCDKPGSITYASYPSPDEVRIYSFGTGTQRGTAWFVLAGNRLAVFTVVGAPTLSWDAMSKTNVANVLYTDLRAW